MALPAGRISIVGRLSAPMGAVAREVAARGGTVQRGLSRQTGVVVVARTSVRQLAGGRLQAKIAQADRQGAVCISETAFLRALGLLPDAAPMTGAIALDALADKAGLDPEVVRLLVLFDLIEPCDGQCSFARSGERARGRAAAGRRPGPEGDPRDRGAGGAPARRP